MKSSFILLGALSLSACTTVDLSQVSTEPAVVTQAETKSSIVEMASNRLVTTFKAKGWSQADTREKAQSAASVLLNGMKRNVSSHDASVVTNANFSNSVALATNLVDDTYKAASLYLDYANDNDTIIADLSSLESALLSARAAQVKFLEAQAKSNRSEYVTALSNFKASIDKLGVVTDEYGVRARTAIATSAKARSES